MPSPVSRLRLCLLTLIKYRYNPKSIKRLVQVFKIQAYTKIKQIITILPWYLVEVLQLLAYCYSIRAISSFYSFGAIFYTCLAKVDIFNTVISALELNVPNLTPSLPTVRSSVYIYITNIILPTV